MAFVWPHPYLVRPAPEIAERFPNAWFGRPHVWSLPSVGDHDFPGQSRMPEAQLKLAFLAQIYDDAHDEPALPSTVRKDATAFLALTPLTSAAFDHYFTLEALGLQRELDVDLLSTDALRAVLPREATDVVMPLPYGWLENKSWSLRDAWQKRITARAEAEIILISALRHVVPRLLAAHADELCGGGCHVSGLGLQVPPRAALDALLVELDAQGDGTTALWIRIEKLDGPVSRDGDTWEVEVEATVEVRQRRGKRSWPSRRGRVAIRMTQAADAWNASEATRITEQREPM